MKLSKKLPYLFFLLASAIFLFSSCDTYKLAKTKYSYLNKVDAGTSDILPNTHHIPAVSQAAEQALPVATFHNETPIEITDITPENHTNNSISNLQVNPFMPLKKNIADHFFNQIQPKTLLSASSSGEKFSPLVDPWTVILWLLIILLIAAILSLLRIDILTILGIVFLVLLILLLVGYLSYY